MEEALSDLYGWYGEIFSEDSEAALLFKALSSDEKEHAKVVEAGERLAEKHPDGFKRGKIDCKEVEAVITQIGLKRTSAAPTPEAAVKTALEFEFCAIQKHYLSIVENAFPLATNLLVELAEADHAHIMRLLHFSQARGYIGDAVPESAAPSG
jgi:hypothetical protein